MQCQCTGKDRTRFLSGVGSFEHPVAVLDDDRRIVVAHAGFGQRKGSGAEGALSRHPANQPLSAAAPWAMIHLMLTINDVISASRRVVPHLKVTKRWNRSHKTFLSVALNDRN